MLPLSETIRPTDPAGVARAVREACVTKTPVYPLGGRTELGFGPVPTVEGLGLSLEGLDQVVDVRREDLTITVEAGVTIDMLRQQLAEQGQRLPIDVARSHRATIGGVAATSPCGPRRLTSGTIRDYVLGLEAVDGTGMTFSAGGKVVKNAAGHDLARLMVGSLGTLGVITRLTLMVRPIPDREALLLIPLADVEHARTLATSLDAAAIRPAALELLVGSAWDVPQLAPNLFGHLVVALEGSAEEVDGAIDVVRRVADEAVLLDEDISTRLWQEMIDFPHIDPTTDPATVVAEAHLMPSRLIDTIETLVRTTEGISLQAHAGDGILKIRHDADAESLRLLVGAWRGTIEQFGGRMVIRAHSPASQLDSTAIWGPSSPSLRVMEALKHQFDPHNILNPGRYVFG